MLPLDHTENIYQTTLRHHLNKMKYVCLIRIAKLKTQTIGCQLRLCHEKIFLISLLIRTLRVRDLFLCESFMYLFFKKKFKYCGRLIFWYISQQDFSIIMYTSLTFPRAHPARVFQIHFLGKGCRRNPEPTEESNYWLLRKLGFTVGSERGMSPETSEEKKWQLVWSSWNRRLILGSLNILSISVWRLM